jgi:Leucine-rich repeat (LRR) protein
MKIILSILTISTFLLGGCTNTNKPIEENNIMPDENPAVRSSQKQANENLNLSNQRLEKIPSDVFEQTNLEELNVSDNLITGSIQAEIRHLKNLRVLNASNNLMTGVPAEIGQLQNLEMLDLSNNQLTGLPYELGNLNNLKTLNISGNNYSELDLKTITDKLPRDVDIIK